MLLMQDYGSLEVDKQAAFQRSLEHGLQLGHKFSARARGGAGQCPAVGGGYIAGSCQDHPRRDLPPVRAPRGRPRARRRLRLSSGGACGGARPRGWRHGEARLELAQAALEFGHRAQIHTLPELSADGHLDEAVPLAPLPGARGPPELHVPGREELPLQLRVGRVLGHVREVHHLDLGLLPVASQLTSRLSQAPHTVTEVCIRLPALWQCRLDKSSRRLIFKLGSLEGLLATVVGSRGAVIAQREVKLFDLEVVRTLGCRYRPSSRRVHNEARAAHG
mmetsp:Transcript_78082/g.253352  ORF Transcript_78082/g.253352 Transcript_78082/m.253352 type:complete len:277 (+) Transcript_78082:392-1222(+)